MIAKTAIKSKKNILKEERVRSNGMSNELNRLSRHFKIVQLPGGAVVLLSCFTSLNTSFYFILLHLPDSESCFVKAVSSLSLSMFQLGFLIRFR